jgi:hypothetical protein
MNVLPDPEVRNHIENGIHFVNEIFYNIEKISLKYDKHISTSIKLNNFDNIDNSLTIAIKHLEEYKKYHENVLSDYKHYFNK